MRNYEFYIGELEGRLHAFKLRVGGIEQVIIHVGCHRKFNCNFLINKKRKENFPLTLTKKLLLLPLELPFLPSYLTFLVHLFILDTILN